MAPRELGVSIVWWPELEPLLSAVPELLDALEVEPQALWVESPHADRPYRIEEDALAQVLAHPQPKLAHGVGFPVGSARRPDRRAFPTLVRSIEELDAAWASEHLGVNRALGPEGLHATGFLLPPRQTEAGVEEAAASIRSTAAELPVPFAFETGVNYLRPREDELDDGAFAAAVAEAADCGILLDLHNLYVNERNGRQPAREFVAQLPLERVWEVHVAGGFEFQGYWLDAHSGRMPEPLVELAEEVIPQLPALGALTFELLPDFFPDFGIDGVARELVLLRRLWQRRATAVAPPRQRTPLPALAGGPSPLEWEDALGAAVAGRPTEALGAELASDPGVGVLRELVHELRAGMTVDALRLTARLLALSLGPEGLRALLEEHWERTPPALFAATEAEAFARFLAERRPPVPYLPDVLAFERAWLAARSGAAGRHVVLAHDPDRLLAPLAQGRLPEAPPAGRFEVVVEA
jgi:uncharacterized protein (UPF0276 family)